MPFSALDLAVLGVISISALLAAVRGFAREILGILAWIIAAAAAWFLFPSLVPFVSQYIAHDMVAIAVSAASIFIVTLVIMSFITVQISDMILDSRIGAMDRTLGFVFGIVRGFVVCVLAWLLFSMLLLDKIPEWAANAKSLPVLQKSSDPLKEFFNSKLNDLLAQIDKKKAAKGTANDSSSSNPAQPAGNTTAPNNPRGTTEQPPAR